MLSMLQFQLDQELNYSGMDFQELIKWECCIDSRRYGDIIVSIVFASLVSNKPAAAEPLNVINTFLLINHLPERRLYRSASSLIN